MLERDNHWTLSWNWRQSLNLLNDFKWVTVRIRRFCNNIANSHWVYLRIWYSTYGHLKAVFLLCYYFNRHFKNSKLVAKMFCFHIKPIQEGDNLWGFKFIWNGNFKCLLFDISAAWQFFSFYFIGKTYIMCWSLPQHPLYLRQGMRKQYLPILKPIFGRRP